MSEMLERVALAIQHARLEDQDSWGQARAAIEAMREPTEEMIDAGGSWTNDEEHAQRRCFMAMIDAALNKSPPPRQ